MEPWKKVSTDYFNAINNGSKECLELVADPRRVVEVYFLAFT